MRTLHLGLRVADRARSLAFYTALGYEIVGNVPETPIGHLTMLRLPDDEFVTIELVDDPAHAPATTTDGTGGALSHFVIQVESVRETIAALTTRGIAAEEPTSPDGSADFRTTVIIDPDGNRIELVQWPEGHPVGFTAEDFA